MPGKVSRDKGQRGERELRDLFRAAGYEAERGGQQSAGPRGIEQDVRHSIPGIWAECKRVEAFSCLTRAIDQARKDSTGADLVPTVWSRTNRDEWLVTLPASAFFNFLLRGVVG